MTEIPFATSVPDVPVNITVPLLPGDIVHVAWTGATVDHACGPYHYAVQVSTNGGDAGPPLTFNFPTPGSSTDLTITAAASELHIIPYTDSWCSTGVLHGVTFSVDQVGYCQYGTRPKAGTDAVIFLTSALLQEALAATGMGFLYSLLATYLFQRFVLNDICAGPRPAMPIVDLGAQEWSPEQIRRALEVVLWARYCECVPGTPAPVPYPPITQPQPPGWPTAPTFPCSNTDVCAELTAIHQLLASMNAMLASDLQLATLQQRYTLPFASIPGARHVSLTGSGSFAISRLLGVSVVLEDFATQPPVLEGNPPYVMNLGWISVSDGDGMLQEKRFTQQAMTWFPQQMAMATLLGYSLRPGVVATITELYAEP